MKKLLTSIALAGALALGVSGCSKTSEIEYSCKVYGGSRAVITTESKTFGPFSTEKKCLSLIDTIDYQICEGDRKITLGCENGTLIGIGKNDKMFYGKPEVITTCSMGDSCKKELVRYLSGEERIMSYCKGKDGTYKILGDRHNDSKVPFKCGE